jgi:hypothetical protein
MKEVLRLREQKIDANQTKMHSHHERMMACLGRMEATDLEANPEEESVVEHQEVPKEEAAVKPVGGLGNRHRGRYLAAERHQKQKERTWGK